MVLLYGKCTWYDPGQYSRINWDSFRRAGSRWTLKTEFFFSSASSRPINSIEIGFLVEVNRSTNGSEDFATVSLSNIGNSVLLLFLLLFFPLNSALHGTYKRKRKSFVFEDFRGEGDRHGDPNATHRLLHFSSFLSLSSLFVRNLPLGEG